MAWTYPSINTITTLTFAVFCSPDLLHLRRSRQGEQGGLRSLHDLQQAGLQAGFPRHLVGVSRRGHV